MSLVVDHLRKRFGSVVALDDLAFEVAPGQVFGFLGANGAGKTTTMRITLGVLEPDAGRVTWDGVESHLLPRSTWGYLPEERGLYPRMRVLDQLVFFAGLHGVSPERAKREANAWLHRFRADDLAGRRAEQLSKGNQQKVQFIASILHDPQVVLMDEPFTGLDPINVALLREALLELAGRGRTLIISTHQMELAEALADSVAIIDRGRLVTSGPTREIRRRAGRSIVRLAVAGDRELAWATTLVGVRQARSGLDVTELTLEVGVDPQAILHAVLERGASVTCFEVADPSLEEVFIELVAPPGAAGQPGHDSAGRSSELGSAA
jgi:ABC-2 type transport system ATP-binding protein